MKVMIYTLDLDNNTDTTILNALEGLNLESVNAI